MAIAKNISFNFDLKNPRVCDFIAEGWVTLDAFAYFYIDDLEATFDVDMEIDSTIDRSRPKDGETYHIIANCRFRSLDDFFTLMTHVTCASEVVS